MAAGCELVYRQGVELAIPVERRAYPIVTDLATFAGLVPLDHGLCVINTLRGEAMAEQRRAAVLIAPRRAYTNPQTS